MVRRKTQMTNKLRKTMSLLTGLVFACVLAFGVLAACKDTEETPRFTVTFLDGESVIAEREVEEGPALPAGVLKREETGELRAQSADAVAVSLHAGPATAPGQPAFHR